MKSTIDGMRKRSTMRKPAGLFITHRFAAQDGPFMIMGTGKEMTKNKWESYRNKMFS